MCAQNQYLELQVWYRHTTVFTQPMIQSTTKKFSYSNNLNIRVSSKKSLWQQCGMGSAILRTWALKLIIIYSSQVGSAWKSCSREFCITCWFQQTWLFDSTTYRVYYTLLYYSLFFWFTSTSCMSLIQKESSRKDDLDSESGSAISDSMLGEIPVTWKDFWQVTL